MTIASITAAATSADAKPKHRHLAQAQLQEQTQAQVTCEMRGCSDSVPTATTRKARRGTRQRNAQVDANGNGVVIGGRPSGCPSRFCGCEASLYVFGEIRKDLNLAYNWVRKFPRTQAAPGMVAARSGHVMVLMRHVEGNEWVVHDGNSGGGRTREHVRSIAGFAIVNPHATVLAQQ